VTDGPWLMFAGIQRGNVPAPGDDPDETVYCDVAQNPRHARAHGHADPVPVEVSESPAGPYWG